MRSDIDPNNAGYELSGDWTGVQFDPSGKPYDGTTITREPAPDRKNFLYHLNPNNLTVPTSLANGWNFPANTDWRIYVGESLQAVTVNTGNPIPSPYITQRPCGCSCSVGGWCGGRYLFKKINLISAQRSYQANTGVITSSLR